MHTSYFRAIKQLIYSRAEKPYLSRRSKLWVKMFSKTLREICRNTGFLWSVFSHIWTESYPYFKLPNAWNGIINGLFSRSQKFSYFRQIVNDVNIELSNICYLYQILFLKPNDNGYTQMKNSIISCFGTMIYIFLKLVIKTLQLHYSILFYRVTHLNQHHFI